MITTRKPAMSMGRATTVLGMVLVLSLVLLGSAGGEMRFQGKAPIPACADGTVASYLGTTCSQLPAVMQWTSYSCNATPKTICGALGTNGANIRMRMDPAGNHTILVTSGGAWNVTAGQTVRVVIRGLVYGATTNNNWPHFGTQMGQTGDGTEENKTTVFCTVNCVSLQGISDVPCSNTSPAPYCVDHTDITPYLPLTAKFAVATPDHPYQFTIVIKLNGGITGTATLKSVGVHLS